MEPQIQKMESQILKENCKDLDLAIVKTLNIENIIKLQGVQIRTLQHHFLNDLISVQNVIMKLVIDLTKSLNLQNTLNSEQIRQIPDLLDDAEFANLTIEDIALICRRIKTGKYGTFFRMDIPTFFDIVRKYGIEKLEKIYQENDKLKEDLQYKNIRIADNKQKEIEKQRNALARYLTEKK